LKRHIIFVLLLLVIGCSGGSEFVKPVKIPTGSTPKEKEMLREGVAYHDNQNYEQAINIYRKILESDPENLDAMYELAYSLINSGQIEEGLDIALKGLEYDSPVHQQFTVMVGNCYDMLGDPGAAIDFYKSAIEQYPDEQMLYYNLGITYYGQNEYGNAKTALTESIRLNPNHPGSYLVLCEIAMTEGKQILSLLLVSRFLSLEPRSQRAVKAHQYLQNLISQGVEQETEEQVNINMLFDLDGETEIFGTTELMFKINRATRYLEENKYKSEIEFRLEEFIALVESVSSIEITDNVSFLEAYLIKYYSALKENEKAEVFFYTIYQIIDDESIQLWLEKNVEKVNEFEKWSRNFLM